jgi:hypothetical protein
VTNILLNKSFTLSLLLSHTASGKLNSNFLATCALLLGKTSTSALKGNRQDNNKYNNTPHAHISTLSEYILCCLISGAK